MILYSSQVMKNVFLWIHKIRQQKETHIERKTWRKTLGEGNDKRQINEKRDKKEKKASEKQAKK